MAQTELRIKNPSEYTSEEIQQVSVNLKSSINLIDQAYSYLKVNYRLEPDSDIEKWNNDSTLYTWLGKAKSYRHIRKAKRRLYKMKKRTDRIAYLKFDKENKGGLCKGSRHAWTVPKGRFLIHLCPQFMYKSNKLQTKIFVHEIAHESGILFHKRVYWRSAALNTAQNSPKLALKNPENFAFFIMTFYKSNLD